MAAPTDATRAAYVGSSAATSHAVTTPAGVSVGNFLVMLARTPTTGTINTPAGFTALVANNTADASDDNTSIFYATATTAHTGSSITVTLSASQKLAAVTWRIVGWGGAVPGISTAATGSSTAPNATAVSPGSTDNWLFLTLYGQAGEQGTPTGTPTNYNNPTKGDTGTAGTTATNCTVAGASRGVTASSASEDAGAWTTTATGDWTAWTLAIAGTTDKYGTDSGSGSEGTTTLAVALPQTDTGGSPQGSGDTGQLLGTTATTATGGSGSNHWTTPNNVLADDSSGASVSWGNADGSDLLLISGFGANVPAGSTVTGFDILADKIITTSGTVGLNGNASKDGINFGTGKDFALSASPETLGNSTDLWGLTSVSPAEANSSSFTVRIQGYDDGSGSGQVNVDCIKIRFYYSTATGEVAVTASDSAAKSGTDSATGTDASSEAAALPGTESSNAGTDTSALAVQVTGTDSGAGAEGTSTLDQAYIATDSGAGTEAGDVPVKAAADTGTGSEASTLAVGFDDDVHYTSFPTGGWTPQDWGPQVDGTVATTSNSNWYGGPFWSLGSGVYSVGPVNANSFSEDLRLLNWGFAAGAYKPRRVVVEFNWTQSQTASNLNVQLTKDGGSTAYKSAAVGGPNALGYPTRVVWDVLGTLSQAELNSSNFGVLFYGDTGLTQSDSFTVKDIKLVVIYEQESAALVRDGISDSGTGADAGTVSVPISATPDTGSGTEVSALAVSLPQVDSATGVDVATVVAVLSAFDVGQEVTVPLVAEQSDWNPAWPTWSTSAIDSITAENDGAAVSVTVPATGDMLSEDLQYRDWYVDAPTGWDAWSGGRVYVLATIASTGGVGGGALQIGLVKTGLTGGWAGAVSPDPTPPFSGRYLFEIPVRGGDPNGDEATYILTPAAVASTGFGVDFAVYTSVGGGTVTVAIDKVSLVARPSLESVSGFVRTVDDSATGADSATVAISITGTDSAVGYEYQAFGKTPILSSFTGADQNPISEGGNWANLDTAHADSLKRLSNQAASNVTTTGESYWTPATFGPDVEVYVTIATLPLSGNNVDVSARIQSPGGTGTYDGYRARGLEAAQDSIVISEVLNAVNNAMVTKDITWAAGEKIGLRCIGDHIEAWRYTGGSWQMEGMYVDSTYSAAGNIALHIRGTTGRADDFGGGTLVGYELATQIVATDSGAATDASALAVALAAVDSGAGTEASSLETTSPDKVSSDAGTGAEASALTVDLPQTDTGSAADASTLAAVLSGTTDTGSGADASTLDQAYIATDTGAGAEGAVVLAVTIPVTETGTGTDASALAADLAATDSAVGTEVSDVFTGSTPKAGSDSGAGTEEISAFAIAQFDGGGIYYTTGQVSNNASPRKVQLPGGGNQEWSIPDPNALSVNDFPYGTRKATVTLPPSGVSNNLILRDHDFFNDQEPQYGFGTPAGTAIAAALTVRTVAAVTGARLDIRVIKPGNLFGSGNTVTYNVPAGTVTNEIDGNFTGGDWGATYNWNTTVTNGEWDHPDFGFIVEAWNSTGSPITVDIEYSMAYVIIKSTPRETGLFEKAGTPDTGAGSDASALAASYAVTDDAVGTDASQPVEVGAHGYDDGTASEVGSIANAVAVVESLVGVEASLLSALIGGTETGSSTDVTGGLGLGAADVGTGVESLGARVFGAAELISVLDVGDANWWLIGAPTDNTLALTATSVGTESLTPSTTGTETLTPASTVTEVLTTANVDTSLVLNPIDYEPQ